MIPTLLPWSLLRDEEPRPRALVRVVVPCDPVSALGSLVTPAISLTTKVLVAFHVLALSLGVLTLAFPNPFKSSARDLTPKTLGLEFESVSLQGGLCGWYIHRPGATRAVLVCHGRSRDKAYMLPLIEGLSHRYHVLAYDMPAHGDDSFGVTSTGFHEASSVSAALDYLEQRGHQDIAIYGASMGGAAVLLDQASKPRASVRAIITDGTFANLQDLVRTKARTVHLPRYLADWTLALTGWVVGYEPRSLCLESAASKIQVPYLVMHGQRDSVCDPASAQRLAEAAGSWSRLAYYEGDHDEPSHAGMQAHVTRFLSTR